MTLDVPAVVIESPAEATPRPLSALGVAFAGRIAWETAESVRAVELPEPPTPPKPHLDPERASRLTRIETIMRDARTELDVADVAQLGHVRAALAAAYGEARAHAEDPEAPFLVAELLRLLARAELVAGDLGGASALRARARLLDGGRLLGLSEGAAPLPPQAPLVTVTWTADADPGTVAYLDGNEHAFGPAPLVLTIEPGEHHVRIVARDLRDPSNVLETSVWAGWIVVAAAEPARTFLLPRAPIKACSRDDLAPALTAVAADANGHFAVGCTDWALLREKPNGALEVRRCDAHGCAPPVVWMTKPKGKSGGDGVDPPPPSTSIWRSGWTYAAIGAVAAVAGGLAAWRLGAFDRGEAPPATLRWEGVK